MPRIDICFASDERYAPYMGVALSSVIAHAAPEDELHFHILDNGILQGNKQKLEEVCRQRPGTKLGFYSLISCCNMTSFILTHDNLTPTAYGRLFIGRFLPASIQRVIYLDCDVFVRDSLAPLMTMPLPEPYVLGGVEDIGVMQLAFEGKHPWPYQTHCYINSGVLLIDLARWRSGNWEEKCLEYLKHPAYPLQYEDQDVINFVLRDLIKLLPHPWNGQVYWEMYEWRHYHAVLYLKRVLKHCPILHYATSAKPWLGSSMSEFNRCYRRFMKRSLWKDEIHDIAFGGKFKILFKYILIHPNFLLSPKFYWRLKRSGIGGLL